MTRSLRLSFLVSLTLLLAVAANSDSFYTDDCSGSGTCTEQMTCCWQQQQSCLLDCGSGYNLPCWVHNAQCAEQATDCRQNMSWWC